MDPQDLERIAAELLAAADSGRTIEPFGRRTPGFDAAAAYAVSSRLAAERQRRGWSRVGRKIGFTNRTIWPRYGVHEPIWGFVYDASVEFAVDSRATVSLAGLVQPRLEPEIAVRFAAAPAGDTPAALLAAIDWVAPCFEIVQCHFPQWRFELADTVADFGLHGRLVVGTPVALADWPAAAWLTALEQAGASLRRAGELVDTGSVENVLGGPLHALCHLVRVLRGQPSLPPLAAGEVVTTGTITDAHAVSAGERWRSSYRAIPFAGLTLDFIE